MVYIYRHCSLICAQEVIAIFGIYVAFKGHICHWNNYGYSMVNKVADCCFILNCMCSDGGLCVYYGINAVGPTCVM